jgi:hypothetical protein
MREEIRLFGLYCGEVMAKRGVAVCIALATLAFALWMSLGKEPEALVFAELPPLTGPVILTVTGDFNRVAGGEMAFDLAMLQALDATRFSTSSIWTDGVHEYTGVSLHRLAAYLGIDQGAMLKCAAINDYAIDVPVSDAVSGGPMIAYAMDGAPMSVREKGPLWLLYPYDSHPDYQSEVIYTRSIWQLDRIEVTADGG